MTYYIRSGDFSATVEADNPHEAAQASLADWTTELLGELMEVTADDDIGNPTFIKTRSLDLS